MPVKIIQSAPSAYAYPLLIKHLLHTPLATSPDQEICYQGKLRFTYRTLRERIGRLASGLAGLGVEAGNTVAVMDWDSHRYLECFFAVPMMGAILQTVNVRLSAEQILYTLNHAKADVLLVNREFLPIVAAIAPRLERLRRFVLIDDEGGPVDVPVVFASEYEQLLAASSPNYDFPDFDENAQATVFYTTGTTGLPKGVYFSHRQLVLHTLGVATNVGTASVHGRLHREDVYMPITPMFHVHAWGFPYVATLLGVKQVYPGKYLPGALLQLLRDENVTFSHCVPSILQMLFAHPDFAKTDLSRWKVVIGGSAMSQALASAALKKGVDAFTGYGMSETCPVLTIAHLTAADLDAPEAEQVSLRCKTGLPLPLVDLRIVTAEMNDVAHDGNTTGEVVVRSPWLTQGYLDASQPSQELWAGGYLHTQDIGNIDARGYLKITDRIKDVIKTAGEWASSLQLEDVVGAHEAVQEVAVIGLPDEKWGERPLALVVLKPEFEGKVSEHAIRNASAALIEKTGISRHGVLLQVRFVKALLKTSVGKINKRAMRESLDTL
ncbi:fatty acid--CoA ligase [Propionivibrio dicarboxylicus]|uniref:Fatty-acyl-CoA synthase n=1 Tax=Propionivibrio dicarboxylicus TaxID=83767 RepID=A0A1G7WTT9_9RHOO|nr:fatty acid--CoA ligase [Propionivibrio dicarboxylicus]SDG75339.1 fatty-acyl-CoA synthase [Propionivibrio dicarboxylicus]